MTLTFYPLDVKFMLTLRPLKISYPQLSEESIQVISKFKTICLPTEKQFTYQLQSTVLTEGMEISSIKGKGWRGGCFIIKFLGLGLHILSANPHKEVTFPPILQITESQRENNMPYSWSSCISLSRSQTHALSSTSLLSFRVQLLKFCLLLLLKCHIFTPRIFSP